MRGRIGGLIRCPIAFPPSGPSDQPKRRPHSSIMMAFTSPSGDIRITIYARGAESRRYQG